MPASSLEDRYRKALEEIAAYSDEGVNIGMSNTCGKLKKIAQDALDIGACSSMVRASSSYLLDVGSIPAAPTKNNN